MTDSSNPRPPARIAAVVSLAFHAAAILVLWMLPGRPAAAPDPGRPIEVLLRAAPPAPRLFTELPADRADEKPDQPDFLSNVDSRARDDAPGGEESLPRMEGESDAPQVEMADASSARESAPSVPAPEPDPAPSPEPQGVEPTPALPAVLRTPEPESPEPETELSVRSLASLDVRQQAMRNPAGNAALSGDISLSTTAWEYAPWLQAFRRTVTERWLPPVAYRMGLIDGWVLARVEVAPDGTLLHVEVLDQDVGNPSLTDAVVYALKAPAPYHKLPAGFPDPSLVLTIRFVYPAVKRR